MQSWCTKVIAVLFGMSLLATARADNSFHVAYQEPLEQLEMGYTSSVDEQKPRFAALRNLSFDAFGRRFDINLEVNRTLLDAAYRESLGSDVAVYRGDIAGMPNSWVRLVVANDAPRGMLWDGNELWAIEVGANAKPFIFRLADLQITPGAMTCSHVGAAKNAGEFAKAMMTEGTTIGAQAPGAASQIDFAVIADFEFTTAKAPNVDAALISRMSIVDGIFSEQLGVQLNVNRIDTYAANNDPFTDTTDADTLLDELTAFRDATPSQHANGLSHLFTGRDLDTTTVGIAYTGALCRRRVGAGLTQGTHSETMDSLIAAHEIGHNFGAPHDGTSGSACESEPQDFLMAPRLNRSDTFSACSITQMQDDVSRASCVSAMPGTDAAIVAGGQPGPVLLGNSTTITFEANSAGTEAVNGASVNVTIPSGVNLDSVSSTMGSCSNGAGSASCTIGSIAAGSGATVTIAVTPSAIGASSLVANITADIDDNANNNQATVQISVSPAVDLVSAAAPVAQISLNQSTTIRPVVENRSSISATNVTVTLTPTSGLNLDAASWPAGNCSVAGNVATCQAASLAPQSSAVLQIAVTGVSEGNQSYALNVTATEGDRNTANNDASGRINVGTVASNNDDGGSGSLGWLSLLLLLLASGLNAGRRELVSRLSLGATLP